MKVLAISDEEERCLYTPSIRERFGDVALVLSCGDLRPEYLEYIVTMLNVPLCYVRGNHDYEFGRRFRWPGGCENVHRRTVHVAGLLVGGLEGSVGDRPERVHYTQREMYLQMARMVPRLLWNRAQHGRYLDILVTHAPPHGIHTLPDPAHQGFRAFLTFMDWFRPRFLVHGHCISYHPGHPRRTRYRETEVVNAFGYQVLDL